MNLRSISILNNDTERNALAHPNIIAKYANVSLILFIRCMTLIVAEILHPSYFFKDHFICFKAREQSLFI